LESLVLPGKRLAELLIKPLQTIARIEICDGEAELGRRNCFLNHGHANVVRKYEIISSASTHFAVLGWNTLAPGAVHTKKAAWHRFDVAAAEATLGGPMQ